MTQLKLIHTERGDVDLLDTARENRVTIDQLIKARPSPPIVITERMRAAGIEIFGRAAWDEVERAKAGGAP